MKRSFPLAYKVILAFAIVLLPILVTFILTLGSISKNIERLMLEELRGLAEARAEDVQLFLEMTKNRVLDFSSDGLIRESLERDIEAGIKEDAGLSRYLLESKLPLAKGFYRLTILGTDGLAAASTNRARVGADESAEEFFRKGLEGLSISMRSKGFENKPEIAISAPIYGLNNGRGTGGMGGFVPIEKLDIFRVPLMIEPDVIHVAAPRYRTMDIYLVGSDKLMLTPSWLLPDTVMAQSVDTSAVRACFSENRDFTGFYKDYREVMVAGASICMPTLGWVLITELDRAEVLAPVRRIQVNALLTLIVTVALISALVVYFFRLVLMQLKGFASASAELASGNYSVRVPVRTSDEIGLLAESFNRMAGEIKQRTEALAASEESFRGIMDNTTSVVYLKDLEGRYVLINRRYEELFHISREELAGRTDYDIFPKETADRFRANDLAALASERPLEFEEIVPQEDGMHAYFSVKYRLKGPDGKPFAVAGISTDITERKRAEDQVRRLNLDLERKVSERTAELEAANREMEAFSYSVAHDLKSPLRTIGGFSRILAKDYAGSLDSTGLDYLGRLQSASARMGELIDSLLRLSQVMRAEMTLERVYLSGMARTIAEELRRASPERVSEFIIHDNLAAVGDQPLLRIAMENLMGNAWKFTGKKGAARIEFGSSGEEGGRTVFFVRDNGAGFEMKHAEKLFIPFQRLHGEDEFPGTGIGLATVQRIIQRHGGRIWAEGEKESGATFYFTL